jgi:hypothetical protein
VASKWGCCVGVSLRFKRERGRREKAGEKVLFFPCLAHPEEEEEVWCCSKRHHFCFFFFFLNV